MVAKNKKQRKIDRTKKEKYNTINNGFYKRDKVMVNTNPNLINGQEELQSA